MIGVFDYTVLLTYASLISASLGTIIALSDGGHPYLGTFFLLFCGLCDAFDGKVAHTKKNRTDFERSFGIQIDSLSDVLAFGVLPAAIGMASIYRSPSIQKLFDDCGIIMYIGYAIVVLYVLAAMIRLAYFNVTEEERQRVETGTRKYYVGLPVTSAALIFPSVMLLNYVLPMDLSIIFVPVMLITALCFLLKFKMPKVGLRGILIMVGIGVLECAALVFVLLNRR